MPKIMGRTSIGLCTIRKILNQRSNVRDSILSRIGRAYRKVNLLLLTIGVYSF